MSKILVYSLVLFACAHICVSLDKDHEMCCNFCSLKYGISSDLESACLRGCRIYGVIFLTHDRMVERSEIAGLCAKSCSSGPSVDACSTGCSQQERIFRERQVSPLSAKLAVIHGLSGAPVVDSPAPYHSRMFSRLSLPTHGGNHQHSAGQSAWLRAVRISVRPMPPGPDGRPRYWVEMSEHVIPLRIMSPDAIRQQQHLQVSDELHRYSLAARLTPRARSGIRWAACALLIMSVIGLLWLCCSVFPTAPRVRVLRTVPLSKQSLTSIQSGDVLGVRGPEDKMPLLLSEEALAGKGADTV